MTNIIKTLIIDLKEIFNRLFSNSIICPDNVFTIGELARTQHLDKGVVIIRFGSNWEPYPFGC